MLVKHNLQFFWNSREWTGSFGSLQARVDVPDHRWWSGTLTAQQATSLLKLLRLRFRSETERDSCVEVVVNLRRLRTKNDFSSSLPVIPWNGGRGGFFFYRSSPGLLLLGKRRYEKKSNVSKAVVFAILKRFICSFIVHGLLFELCWLFAAAAAAATWFLRSTWKSSAVSSTSMKPARTIKFILGCFLSACDQNVLLASARVADATAQH